MRHVAIDHIAAVANLVGYAGSRRRAILAGGLWPLGHGLSLLFVGSAVLLLGMAIPEGFSALAEHLVALVLTGVVALWMPRDSTDGRIARITVSEADTRRGTR